jgi:hypothetical protein
MGGALFVVFNVVVAYPQSAIPVPQVQIPRTPVRKASTQPPQPPCYEVAGVSKAAIEERQNVVRGANAQVEAVCANASLTPQQRAQEIRQIRQQQRAQMNAIITPQQQEAINACNKARHPNPVAGAPHPGPARGPCGELLPPAGSPTQHPQPTPGPPSGGTPQPTTGIP